MLLLLSMPTYSLAIDPLPSWNEGRVKKGLIDFVASVTDKESDQFVPLSKRIAVFDNDGTLWCEKPLYPQFIFASNRYKQIAKKDSGRETEPVFRYALKDNYVSLAKTGSKGIQQLVGKTHFGMSSDQFESIVMEWMHNAEHPRFRKPYNECIYQPMKEVLAYLRDNGFKTFIVSGGGRDFMRPWADLTYGIKPYQIVGSSCKLEFSNKDNKAKILRSSKIEFLNDGKEKPVGIQKYIGIRPIAAFGNSDGDLQMLQFTSANKRKSFCAIVHHTDSKREYAYDRESSVGKLSKALDQSRDNNWFVIDMKRDWNKVFPFQK